MPSKMLRGLSVCVEIYGKTDNGNEMKLKWKWKQKTNQSLVQCFLHGLMMLCFVSNRFMTGLSHVYALPSLFYCGL